LTNTEQSEHEALIGRYLDGLADRDEAQRLSQLIESDPEVAELYARLGHLHGMLAAHETLEWNAKPVSAALSARQYAKSTIKSLPFLLLGGPIRAANRWSTAAALLAAYVVFYGAFFSLLWSMRPHLVEMKERDRQQLAQLTAESLAKGVATLVETVDGQWEDGHPPTPVGGRIIATQWLRLRSGQAVLQFDGGAEVGIVGPVVARATSAGYMRLEQGRLAAHVPPRAFGFTVETTAARLVDLGTDFSVDANNAGETRMVVSRGAVEVTALAELDGERKKTNPSLRVTAGQAVTVSKAQSGLAVDRAANPPEWVGLLRLKNDSPTALIAYQAPNGVPGNQPGPQDRFTGGLGLDFDVLRPIRIEALGVFDDLGDGIDGQSQLTVQLWSRDDQGTKAPLDDRGDQVLAEQRFDASSQGVLIAGHRFKTLAAPLMLPVGSYSIVSYGFSETNRNLNFNYPGQAPRGVETWRGAIVHVNSRFRPLASPGQFPLSIDPKSYAYVAGSFKFQPVDSAAISNGENQKLPP
jgi:hypothetical protein